MSAAGRIVAAALAAAALAFAGCGAGNEEPDRYLVEPTRECLEQAALTVGTEDLDFVASTALGGGLRVRLPGNGVTIAFGESADDAVRVEQAYRQFAGESIPVDAVLERRKNVVLLWDAPPSGEDATLVRNCLRG